MITIGDNSNHDGRPWQKPWHRVVSRVAGISNFNDKAGWLWRRRIPDATAESNSGHSVPWAVYSDHRTVSNRDSGRVHGQSREGCRRRHDRLDTAGKRPRQNPRVSEAFSQPVRLSAGSAGRGHKTGSGTGEALSASGWAIPKALHVGTT